MAQVTRLGMYGGARPVYGSFSGKVFSVTTKQMKVGDVELVDQNAVGTITLVDQYKVGDIEYVC